MTLTANQQKALDILGSRISGRLISHLNSCVRCGLCGESCHYYLSDPKPEYLPGYKIEQLGKVYRRYHTLPGKLAPKWTGARDLDDEMVQTLVDAFYGSCTLCNRCAPHCSIGVDIAYLIRTGRSMLQAMNLVPKGLQSTVDTALNTGNNMGIPREDLVDTLDWLAEDLQMEVEDDSAAIPLDKKGAQVLYTLNPREPKFFPLSISAISKIFYAAREDWTISTQCYDVTNYAYFSGDTEGARDLVERLSNETVKLQAKTLAMAECGHGFRAFRWEGPEYIQSQYPFEVISIIELLAAYVKSGRITLDKSLNSDTVTLHDPCNLVRNGGVVEEQRYVLNHAVSHFVEMTPNRINNFCCGGGGGALAMSEYKDRRITAGKIKAEQIRATGAKIVATPCHNCIDQLMELNQHYKLGVEIKTVAELVADAIVLSS